MTGVSLSAAAGENKGGLTGSTPPFIPLLYTDFPALLIHKDSKATLKCWRQHLRCCCCYVCPAFTVAVWRTLCSVWRTGNGLYEATGFLSSQCCRINFPMSDSHARSFFCRLSLCADVIGQVDLGLPRPRLQLTWFLDVCRVTFVVDNLTSNEDKSKDISRFISAAKIPNLKLYL